MPDRRGPNAWFFDVWSRFYDAPLVQRLTYRPEHDAVLRELRRASPTCVLDIGCGTGLLTARIHAEPSFGAVVSTEAFHWFPEQDVALRESFRVPGTFLLPSILTIASRPGPQAGTNAEGAKRACGADARPGALRKSLSARRGAAGDPHLPVAASDSGDGVNGPRTP